MDHDVAKAALEAPAFLLKIIPHVDGTPRICELVQYSLTDVTVKGAWTGPGGLDLRHHALAPIADLPVLEILSTVHIVADLTPAAGHGRPRLPGPLTSNSTGEHMQLKDKVAIITGSASGIGKEIALEYAREGAKVVIADLSLAAAQATADEINAGGGQAMAVEMNVTDEAAVDAATAKVVEQFGGVDVLISNAGIQIISPIVDFKYDDWKKLMAIHADGAFLTTRAAMRAMITQGKGGSIIYMGSVHSHEASPLKSAYVTAKHGLIGLAKVVAKEGAKDGIRANVICPGFVRTPLVEKQIPEQAKALGISEDDVIKNVMLKDTVDGEFTTVQDVAQLAVFLAAFPTNALTGQSITVCTAGTCSEHASGRSRGRAKPGRRARPLRSKAARSLGSWQRYADRGPPSRPPSSTWTAC